MNRHEYFMMQALIEGRKALGHSSPNPNVGAVIVKNNRIIGRGHTQIPGQEHAEVMAIKNAGTQVHGSSLYVTLEPCSHFGKTPPCTDYIIKNNIKEVYMGIKDPNPIVCGCGMKQLRDYNIRVREGVLREKIMNEFQWYLKYTKLKLPFVTLKSGISLDGNITDYNQNSKWITSQEARDYAHQWREINDGIIVGINTIIKDNPILAYQGKNKRKQFFYRIILDTDLKIDVQAKVLKPVKNHYTIIGVGKHIKIKEKLMQLKRMKGVEILYCETKNNRIDLNFLLRRLGEKGITKVIVEGGAEVNYHFLKEDLVDKIILFVSPKILGGQKSKNFIGGDGFLLKNNINIKDGRWYNYILDNFIFEGNIHVYRYH